MKKNANIPSQIGFRMITCERNVSLKQGVQMRRLKCEQLMDDGCQVMAKAHIAFGKVSL
jgi:hypothetical protein